MSAAELQALADKTAHMLVEESIAEGAIVIVVGEGKDLYGAALNSPGVPIDTIIALGTQGIGLLRAAAVRAAAKPAAETPAAPARK